MFYELLFFVPVIVTSCTFFMGAASSIISSRILIIVSSFLAWFLVPLKLFVIVDFGLVGGFLQISVILSSSFILKECSKLTESSLDMHEHGLVTNKL